VAARPRQLPVTQIEMWRRDPYAIYARHILGLKALDELDADPGPAALGTTVHKALARFVERHPRELPLFAEDELIAIGRECFAQYLSRPGAWAFWWPRFVRIAHWFVAEERERRDAVAERRAERQGRLVVPAPAGPFTITAIADRIDRRADGSLVLVDYKTGAVPSRREIDNAIAVQLPLEAAIARDGSFDGLSGPVAALEYWRLPGGDPPGIRCPLVGDDPNALIDPVLQAVLAMIARFDDPATPYPPVPVARWRPRFSDYDHLERLDEAEGEPDGEDGDETDGLR
jgi:ATP-dependent helicase/nuclease subunit B